MGFAEQFDKLFSDNFFRVTHHKDPVPQVPPNQLIVDWHFEHTGSEVFYDGDVADGFQWCLTRESQQCADKYWNLAIDLLNVGDHLDYMGQQTSMFGCNAIPGTVAV